MGRYQDASGVFSEAFQGYLPMSSQQLQVMVRPGLLNKFAWNPECLRSIAGAKNAKKS